MYADYLKEREDKEILEDEQGFVIYGYNCVPGLTFAHVYIQDVYTKPEHRQKGVAKKLADKVAQMAKDQGHTSLLGSVDGTANNAHESLLVLIAYGMKLFHVEGSMIWMIKEI